MTNKEIYALNELKNRIEKKLAQVAIAEDYCSEKIALVSEELRKNVDNERAKESEINFFFQLMSGMVTRLIEGMKIKNDAYFKQFKENFEKLDKENDVNALIRLVKETEVLSDKNDVIYLTKRINEFYLTTQADKVPCITEFCDMVDNGFNQTLKMLEMHKIILAECHEVAECMLKNANDEEREREI